MSTTADTEGFLARPVAVEDAEGFLAPYRSTTVMTGSNSANVRYSGYKKADRQPTHKESPRCLRRFQGFLIELQGATARVGFVQNGEVILYDLPSEQLRKSGIEIKNQPFQMDEMEIAAEGGGPIVGYRFQPLAKAEDAFVEAIDLDDSRRKKHDLILKEFAEPKD